MSAWPFVPSLDLYRRMSETRPHKARGAGPFVTRLRRAWSTGAGPGLQPIEAHAAIGQHGGRRASILTGGRPGVAPAGLGSDNGTFPLTQPRPENLPCFRGLGRSPARRRRPRAAGRARRGLQLWIGRTTPPFTNRTSFVLAALEGDLLGLDARGRDAAGGGRPPGSAAPNGRPFGLHRGRFRREPARTRARPFPGRARLGGDIGEERVPGATTAETKRRAHEGATRRAVRRRLHGRGVWWQTRRPPPREPGAVGATAAAVDVAGAPHRRETFRWKYADPARRIPHGKTCFQDSPLVLVGSQRRERIGLRRAP